MSGAEDAERALALADEAYARLDLEALITHLSAAIRALTAIGDKRGAAMACARLGDVFASAMGNLTAARAWFTRARRLLADEPPCIEQGWVAVAAMGCDVDDPDELLAAAEFALERARQFCDVNLETKALADAGLAHVQAGRVERGMALLDEAMALACGPADDIDTAGKSACSFFTACYYAADFERAGSWATLLRKHGLIGPEQGVRVFLSSHCDSVQATLLLELGRWGEAEAVLERAREQFTSVMPFPSWHPDIALADLRIRQGRYAEAEALLVGREQSMQALLPAVRLHLERGDHDLARAMAVRALRAIGDDRLRAAELLTLLVDAELARGDLEAASKACAELSERIGDVDVGALRARSAAARARVVAACDGPAAALAVLEPVVDGLDATQLPWLHATLLVALARLREAAGDRAGAVLDAKAAAAALAGLDVVPSPGDADVLGRLLGPEQRPAAPTASLARDGSWWVATFDGSSVRLPATKGLRYLAELVARPGVERHALDLVDLVEGLDPDGAVDRRSLGDAGELADARARSGYRRRVEALRSEIDDALEVGAIERAEALQADLDALVRELAAAFGVGGRDRKAASAAERARLNVTRALRAATAKLAEAVPGAGAALDRHVRTGLYCAYEPPEGEIRWIVQS